MYGNVNAGTSAHINANNLHDTYLGQSNRPYMKGTVQLQRFNMHSNLTKCYIPSTLSQGILNFADNVAQGEHVS